MTNRRNGTNAEPAAARITCQFRDKQQMVYELACGYQELVLTMSGAPSDAGLWQAGAGLRQSGAAPALHGSGSTRAAALGALAEAWANLGVHQGYPRLDWAAIEKALVAVSAV